MSKYWYTNNKKKFHSKLNLENEVNISEKKSQQSITSLPADMNFVTKHNDDQKFSSQNNKTKGYKVCK